MQQILDLIFLNNEEQKPTKPPRPSPLYLFISNTHNNQTITRMSIISFTI